MSSSSWSCSCSCPYPCPWPSPSGKTTQCIPLHFWRSFSRGWSTALPWPPRLPWSPPFSWRCCWSWTSSSWSPSFDSDCGRRKGCTYLCIWPYSRNRGVLKKLSRKTRTSTRGHLHHRIWWLWDIRHRCLLHKGWRCKIIHMRLSGRCLYDVGLIRHEREWRTKYERGRRTRYVRRGRTNITKEECLDGSSGAVNGA